MNELFDKLIIRLAFTLFICGVLYLYKYVHVIIYPASRYHLLRKFNTIKYSTEYFHFLSHIIGVGILFSELSFTLNNGIIWSLSDFFIKALLSFFLYLASIYVIDSIVLYNFEHQDEISKKKNYSYALITMAHALGFSYILKTIIEISQDSLITLLFLTLLTLVLIGLATKTFKFVSKMPFQRTLLNKNISLALAYLGFFWGWCAIIHSSINHDLYNIKWFTIQVILKILLSLIIYPIMSYGMKFAFKMQDQEIHDDYQFDVSYGLYEGATFFTSAFITTVITGRIDFGTFYPVL